LKPIHLKREAWIYARQSTKKQEEENWGSTEVQYDQRKLALAFGWAESSIRIIDEDLGRSGSSTEQRTGWREMLRLVAADQIGAIFALNAARLSRRLQDFEELRTLCRYHNTLLIIDGRPHDPNDPSDVAMAQVKATFAQLENQMRSDVMKRARMAKARRGRTVSRLPTGWVKGADDTYDFDPEAKAAIAEVFARFWEAGSVRQLVRLLDAEGWKRPVRRKKGLEWKRPDHQAIRFILTNPAYAGQYTYGRSESRPDLGSYPNGHSRRAPRPVEGWVRDENHHPAYVTPAEQQRIRDKLAANRLPNGPGPGTALLQGLVACARCQRTMSVLYKGNHRYHCLFQSATYGGKICISVVGPDVDAAVERAVLNELAAPGIEILRKALAETHTAETRRLEAIDATRQRLTYAERIARERYEECDARNRLVADHLERELERALQALHDFELDLAAQPPPPPINGSEEELQALVQISADVPALWRHRAVTPKDRKELLRCLIERVLISRDERRIDVTIVWRSGARTSHPLRRRAGVYEWVGQLHAEGLTVPEIQERLAAGDPDTGQRWPYVRKHIYVIHKKLGLRPNQRRDYKPAILAHVRRLYDRGLSAPAIARELNATGSTTPTGRPWTKHSVLHALKPPERRFGRRRRPSDPQAM
jgi:DNA invertase Pin-like site-specific DNA recombinase